MTGYMAAVTLPSQSEMTAGGLTSTVIGWGYLFVSVHISHWRSIKTLIYRRQYFKLALNSIR
jgi:hypothetical protein